MAKTTAKAAGFAVLAMMFGATTVHADSPDMPTFVVHLRDSQNVNAKEMATAQAEVSAVYASAGVRIEWTDGAAALATADGRTHVDLIVISRQMADRMERDPGVLGRGSHMTKRAIVFYARLVDQSQKTGSRPESVLAYIIAHELGHVFLPEYSHAPSGLMRASWEGEHMLKVPNFMAAQAQELRLVAANAH
jgi:hypothetical protein